MSGAKGWAEIPAGDEQLPPVAGRESYLVLFHGRSEAEPLGSGWGFDGPVVGPVLLHWTYGTLSVGGREAVHFVDVASQLDLVVTVEDGEARYYGDFDVMCWTEAEAAEFVAKEKAEGRPRRLYTAAEFIALRDGPVRPVVKAPLDRKRPRKKGGVS